MDAATKSDTPNAILVWDGPGVYEPHVDRAKGAKWHIQWWRNIDGDPFLGVQVDRRRNAKTFATVRSINWFIALCEQAWQDEFANEMAHPISW